MTYTIGVDLGGTHVRAGLFNNSRLIKHVQYNTPTKSAKAVVQTITKAVQDVDNGKVKSVGVGCPGPLDYKKGVVVWTPHLPFKNFSLQKELTKQLKKRVVVDNDANCFALAHKTLSPKGIVLGITLGTGLGSGLLIDGNVFHGSLYAPALSKIPWYSQIFTTKNPEGVISAQGILQLARKHKVYAKSPEELATLAKTSQKAREVWSQFGRELGRVLSVAHALFDADVIYVGGSIAQSYQYFNKATILSLKEHSNVRIPKIIKSPLEHPGLIGASLLVR